MIILAMDTSTKVSTVAVLKDNTLMSEVIMQNKLAQSEVLLSHVQTALEIAGISKSDIDTIAISIGPGSFTGLRIGLATAKILAYSLDIPLITVPSLEALAVHHRAPNIYIATVMDAQKKNVYSQIFEWDNGLLTTKQVLAVDAFDLFLAKCNSLDKPVIISGDMAQKDIDKLHEYDNIIPAMPQQMMPRAANVAIVARDKFDRGEFADIMAVEPMYIRRSEAEVLWEKRQQENTDNG